jgi:hypothetical protein
VNTETKIEHDYTNDLYRDVGALLRWRPVIEGILRKNRVLFTFNDLTQMLLKGERLFLHNEESFLIMQVHQWSQGIQVHMCMIGGTRAGLERLEENLMRFVRDIGARQITGLGRKGFEAWDTAWKDSGMKWFIREVDNV